MTGQDTATLAEQITAKAQELEAARVTFQAICDAPTGWTRRPGSSGKQSRLRYDSKLRRAGKQGEVVRRLEAELAALQHRQDNPAKPAPAAVPLDLTRLPFARFIRTRAGWYEVVKVNRATVKVVVDPGWDDLIKISKILQIHEHEITVTGGPHLPTASVSTCDACSGSLAGRWFWTATAQKRGWKGDQGAVCSPCGGKDEPAAPANVEPAPRGYAAYVELHEHRAAAGAPFVSDWADVR